MDLDKKLTPKQFRVTQQAGTEAPFTGKYYNHQAQGNYLCVCCHRVLFSSNTKFDSGTGWPSFSGVLKSNNVKLITDDSHGMSRVEARCANCDAHLGHVFPDGPTSSGNRYCINSASLDFKPS